MHMKSVFDVVIIVVVVFLLYICISDRINVTFTDSCPRNNKCIGV